MSFLRFFFFGFPRIEFEDVAVELPRRKAEALIVYLAVTGQNFSRDHLATLLWADSDQRHARASLRRILSVIKQTPLGDCLLVQQEHISLDRSFLIWMDTNRFRTLVSKGLADSKAGEKLSLFSLEYLTDALSLYRGHFLGGFALPDSPQFEEWHFFQDDELRQGLSKVYVRLIQHYTGLNEDEKALDYAREWLKLDPLREDVHRQLMYLYARTGQRSKALWQFQECQRIMNDELGLALEPETQKLYQVIKRSPANLSRQVIEQESIVPPQNLDSRSLRLPEHTFIVGPPITQPKYFFGREREVKRIFDLWRSAPLQNAAIIGPRCSGKTSFLFYLKNIVAASPDTLRSGQHTDWLSHTEQYQWIFVDFQDPRLATSQGLLRYLLTQLGFPVPEPCDLCNFIEVVSDNLRHPTIILLDEIVRALSSYSELDNFFWEGLRALASHQVGGNLAFVVAASRAPGEIAKHSGLDSPFFNIFGYTIQLGPLRKSEALELIASSPIVFPQADVEWIVKQSGCWPILLQILCRERFIALEMGQADSVWRAEGLRQLEPFQYLQRGESGE